jgi:hypothetical protein
LDAPQQSPEEYVAGWRTNLADSAGRIRDLLAKVEQVLTQTPKVNQFCLAAVAMELSWAPFP